MTCTWRGDFQRFYRYRPKYTSADLAGEYRSFFRSMTLLFLYFVILVIYYFYILLSEYKK